MSKSFEIQKEKAVKTFQTLINTPHVLEIDISFHGSVEEPMVFEYRVRQAVIADEVKE